MASSPIPGRNWHTQVIDSAVATAITRAVEHLLLNFLIRRHKIVKREFVKFIPLVNLLSEFFPRLVNGFKRRILCGFFLVQLEGNFLGCL